MTALVIANILAWIAILALTLTVLALARQVGVLHERVSPIGALTMDQGPEPGSLAPAFTLPLLTGGEISLGKPRPKPVLLFFLSPTCPVCKKLIPVLRSMRAGENAIDIVLASDGTEVEHQDFYRRQKLAPFPYVLSSALGMAFRIGKLPYAVLIGADGRVAAKGLVNNREQIESLLLAREMGVASLQDFFARGAAAEEGRIEDAAD